MREAIRISIEKVAGTSKKTSLLTQEEAVCENFQRYESYDPRLPNLI